MSDSRSVEPWTRESANPKLDRILVTPEGVPLHVTVAAASARAGALMLDIVIIVGLIILATLDHFRVPVPQRLFSLFRAR